MRYVLCRPRGGFNDTLNQIELCWQYAERHDRSIIIDGSQTFFGDRFGHYFHERQGSRLVAMPDDVERLSARPDFVQGRVMLYRIAWLQPEGADRASFHDPTVGKKVRFDFEESHPEDLLVFEDGGGGHIGIAALRRLRFSPMLASEILLRLDALPPSYESMHIRHTDYETPYEELFEEVRRSSEKNILICSDNASVIEEAKQAMPEKNVFTVSEVPDLQGKPLHSRRQMEASETDKIVIDQQCDLVALALSDKIHVTKVSGGFLSGFSRLAQQLHAEKGQVWGLLGLEPPSIDRTVSSAA